MLDDSFYDNVNQLKTWTFEQVLWAENNLKGKSGAEKKAAVVKRLDDLIVLPFYLEWMDDKIIAWLVDVVCDKLNKMTDHKFVDTAITDEQEKSVIDSIDVGSVVNGE